MATVLTPAEIKQKIEDWITTNGSHEITGAHLNTILAAIMDYVGVGYALRGTAPASAPSPDVPSAYLAAPGTYTNYESGDTVIPEGSIAVLMYDGSAWSKSVIKVCDPVSVSENADTGNETVQIGEDVYPEYLTQTDKVLCNTMLDGAGVEYYKPRTAVFRPSSFLESTTGVLKTYNVDSNFYVTPFIPCYGLGTLHFKGLENNNTALCVQYDINKNIISGTVVNGTANETDKDITINADAFYIRFCGNTTAGVVITCNGTIFKEVIKKLYGTLQDSISNINSEIEKTENKIVLCTTMLDGEGSEYYNPRPGGLTKSIYLNKDSGVFRNYGVAGDWYVSPMIPCKGYDTLHFKGLESSAVAMSVQYDINKNIISGTVVNGTAEETDKDITINADAFYIRFCGMIQAAMTISVVDSVYKEANRKILEYLIDSMTTIPENVVSTDAMDNTIKQGVSTNPIKTILSNAGLSAIFHEWGFIGDSLSSGANYDKYGYQSSNIYAVYSYSWCQRLAALIGGARGSNWSVTGFTAKSWIQKYWTNEQKAEYTTDGVDSYFKLDKKQAYTIMLGTNDAGQGVTLGDFSTDVDLADFNNNADTFVGNYAGIIQRIKSVAPSAKIFLFTCPLSSAAETNGYNAAIRDMVNHFTNVFIVDLKTYLPTNSAFTTAYVKDGHFTTQGYQFLSFAIATYIDYIVRTNPNAFKYVEIINTQWDDGTY